ncbi:MAG: SgcJ/EcaC family oxidoreductase [Aquincola sp.]|nr:SgcJ/EcaC family oxidoreductase [Aquincola sp.]
MSIEVLVKAYEKALNTNDLESILNLYGQTPVFMPQHAPALVGREAVRAGYRQVFETIKLNIEFTIHDLEVLGDTAWARTSSAGRTRILSAGIEVAEGNNELFIFKRENGDWKIHRYLFSTTQRRA